MIAGAPNERNNEKKITEENDVSKNNNVKEKLKKEVKRIIEKTEKQNMALEKIIKSSKK